MPKTILFLLWFSLASQACTGVLASASGETNPDVLVRAYFPNAKPGSRGKAYVWWRGRSQSPDAVFDHALMTPAESQRAWLRLGGFIVGEPVSAGPVLPAGVPEGLSRGARTRLERFYEGRPTVLDVPESVLEPFSAAARQAEAKYGSVEAMLRRLDITLELTTEKLRRIRAGEVDGKYAIDTNGRAYFLTEAECARVQAALGLDRFQHGAIGFLVNRVNPGRITGVIDYGNVRAQDRRPTVTTYHAAWNTEEARQLDSLAYLLEYY